MIRYQLHMVKFYNLDDEEISNDEFVKLYNTCYYEGDSPHASRNSRHVEDEIERILKHGIEEETDAVHVLAWKIGKINHKEGEEQEKFIYAADWKAADEQFKVKSYGRGSALKEIATCLVDNATRLGEQCKNPGPQKVLNELRDKNWYGLGTRSAHDGLERTLTHIGTVWFRCHHVQLSL